MKKEATASAVWMRVFEKWVRKGADRSYAVWMADKAEQRAIQRERRKHARSDDAGVRNSIRLAN